MFTYNISYRFQLKKISEGPPFTHAHGPLQTKQNRFLKLKSIIDFIFYPIMITLIYLYYKLSYDAGYFNISFIKPILMQFD